MFVMGGDRFPKAFSSRCVCSGDDRFPRAYCSCVLFRSGRVSSTLEHCRGLCLLAVVFLRYDLCFISAGSCFSVYRYVPKHKNRF